MSVAKALEFLLADDLKGFESELENIKGFDRVFRDVINRVEYSLINVAIVKDNINAIQILLKHAKNANEMVWIGDIVHYIADNSKWDILEMLSKSKCIHFSFDAITNYKNSCLLLKCIEYEIFDDLDIILYRNHEIMRDTSCSVYKYLMQQYHLQLNQVNQKNTLIQICKNEPNNIDAFRELLSVSNLQNSDDLLELCNGLNQMKYQELARNGLSDVVIEIMAESISNGICFDPVLIDLLGIRVKMQNAIDDIESKVNSISEMNDSKIPIINDKFIQYSNLNFRKYVLLYNISYRPQFIDMINTLQLTDQEKSDYILRIIRMECNTYKHLIKMGFKIYNNAENKEVVDKYNKGLYERIPKYD